MMRTYYDIPHQAMQACLPVTSFFTELDFKCDLAFRYHDYVVVGFHRKNTGDNIWGFAIYENDGPVPAGVHPDDAKLTCISIYDRMYSDQGDAIRSALAKCEIIHAERLMKKGV